MRVRDQVHKANEIMFGKDWSEESREAAAEARGGKVKGDRPKSLSDEEMRSRLTPEQQGRFDSSKGQADSASAARWGQGAAYPPSAEVKANYDSAWRAHQATTDKLEQENPQYAFGRHERMLSGSKGVVITARHEDTSGGGNHTSEFHDNLYDAHGKVETNPSGRTAVTLSSPTHGDVHANSLSDARIKMKRLYYGASNPNQSLSQQGMTASYSSRPGSTGTYRFGVGRRAKIQE